jgi:hypothetical protein
MPTIVQIGGLKVQVYSDDHYPKHFHIIGPDFQVVVAMSDLSILKGRRYHREVAQAMEWARVNLDLLSTEWDRLNER